MKGLTSRQQDIFDFIQQYLKDYSYWPSIRDIQAAFGFSSTNAVMGHLRALEQKDKITRTPGQARAYQINNPILSEPDYMVQVPLYGSIAAGYPDGLESGEAVDTIQIDTRMAGIRNTSKTFALRVRGESMIDAGIMDGDLVVLEQRQPSHMDIVAALIDQQTTLKRYMLENNSAYLRAENTQYPDLFPAQDLTIQGVAKAVIRTL